MKSEAQWLGSIANQVFGELSSYTESIDKLKAEHSSNTGGEKVGLRLVAQGDVTLELWYDQFVSAGDGRLRLGACFALPKKLYDLFVARNRKRHTEVDGDKDWAGLGIAKRRLTSMELGLPFFEFYSEGDRWFTIYFSEFANPHLAGRNDKVLVAEAVGFFKEILNSKDFFEDLQTEVVTGIEWKFEDEGSPAQQRMVPLAVRKAAIKAAGNRCQACSYHVEANGIKIIDVHHPNPLKKLKVGSSRPVSSAGLLVLCPNCHRIAHTSEPPLPLLKIKEALGITWKL